MAAAVETLTVKVAVKVDVDSVAQLGSTVVNVDHTGVALADGVELIVNILIGNALILALCFETLVLAERDLRVKGNFKGVGSGAVIGHVHIDDGRSADHAQLGLIKAELESLGGELVHSVLIEDLCAVHALNDSARSLALAEAGNIYRSLVLEVCAVDCGFKLGSVGLYLKSGSLIFFVLYVLQNHG